MKHIAVNLEIKIKEGRKVKRLKVSRSYAPLELSVNKHIKFAMADVLEKLGQ